MPRRWRVQHKGNARNQSSYKKQGKNHLKTIDKQKTVSEPSTIPIAMCDIQATSHQAG